MKMNAKKAVFCARRLAVFLIALLFILPTISQTSISAGYSAGGGGSSGGSGGSGGNGDSGCTELFYQLRLICIVDDGSDDIDPNIFDFNVSSEGVKTTSETRTLVVFGK